MPQISYILPTRNRPETLAVTLRALGSLPPHRAEVIVVDNASTSLPAWLHGGHAPPLANGLPLNVLRLPANHGAAARNHGALISDRASEWLILLDDDSYPTSLDFLAVLAAQSADVLAVAADIHLPRTQRRESGGLPEVFIGCGVAIRRDAFLNSGGYDPSFNYYVEEYDLAARFIASGGSIAWSRSFQIDHLKDPAHRDMNLILARLVRNNGWVMQRYAPESVRLTELRETRRRYRRIAQQEEALRGFGEGLRDLRRTLASQRRTPLPRPLWDRFTGLAAARDALSQAHRECRFTTAAIVDEGKNAWAVRRALAELGIDEMPAADADVLVIGSMSPGPMLDAWERRRNQPQPVVAPWLAIHQGASVPPPLEIMDAAAGPSHWAIQAASGSEFPSLPRFAPAT